MDPIAAFRKQQERLGNLAEAKEKTVEELRKANTRWTEAFDTADKNDDGLITRGDLLQCLRRINGGAKAEVPKRKLEATCGTCGLEKDDGASVDFRLYSRIVRDVTMYMSEHPRWAEEEADAEELEERRLRKEQQQRRSQEAPDVFAILGLKKSKDVLETQAKKDQVVERNVCRFHRAGTAILQGQRIGRALARHSSVPSGIGGVVSALPKPTLSSSSSLSSPPLVSPTRQLRGQWERFSLVDAPAEVEADGKVVARSSKGVSRRHTIDVASDLPQMKLSGCPAACLALRFSPDGAMLAGGYFDGGLRIFDVDDNKLIHCLNLPTVKGGTLDRRPSHDESDMYVDEYVFDPLNCGQNSEPAVTNLRWCPAGCRTPLLASTDTSGTVAVWEIPAAKTKRPPRRLAHLTLESPLDAVSFTQDGRRVFVAGVDRLIRFFDVETGLGQESLQAAEVLGREPPGHCMRIYSLAAHPQNPNVAFSAGLETKICIWDLRAGPGAVGCIYGPQLGGDAMDISRDGQTILTGSHRTERPIQIYDVRLPAAPLLGGVSNQGERAPSRPGTTGDAWRGPSKELPEKRLGSKELTGNGTGSRPHSGSRPSSVSGSGVRSSFAWCGNEAPFANGAKPTSCLVLSTAWDGWDNKTIVAAGEKENMARVLEIPDSGLQDQQEPLRVVGTLYGKNKPFFAAAIAYDGRKAAFGSADGGVVMVDVSPG